MEPDFDMVTIYASINMSHFTTKREKDMHTHTHNVYLLVLMRLYELGYNGKVRDKNGSKKKHRQRCKECQWSQLRLMHT